jgi:hypothetical protein
VILPLFVLRRLDCALELTKAEVLARLDSYAERLYGRLRAEHDQLGLSPASD